MADVTEYMEYKSYSPYLASLHGKKPSKSDRAIALRSRLTHTEKKFPPRYGSVSHSATMVDKCRCSRFKFIEDKHPERWLTVRIPCTGAQVDLIWATACEMADLDVNWYAELKQTQENWHIQSVNGLCFYGPNALKYDLLGVMFSFISKWRIFRPHKKWVWCTEDCFIALMAGFPDLLDFVSVKLGKKKFGKTLKPDDLQPSQGDEIIRLYVEGLTQ